VFDKSEWSRSTSESELMFRRTLLEESGVTVTTHSCGVFEMSAGEALLFVTRIAGMQARDNRSYRARALIEALERHERNV